MLEAWALHKYGGLSLMEQELLTGEQRAWWMNKTQEEARREQEKYKSMSGKIPRR